ncbi:MAG TPA: hypothetical protein VHT75_10710 [Acidimicrobiales bacterium]|jgi:hypothetical protein|nr:hypothetical protein [Acidimicrobiales bacterium]
MGATVEPDELTVAPGEVAVANLRVGNDSAEERRYLFDVLSDAGSWVSVTPFAQTIGAGGEGSAQVMFRPPRSPAVRAGSHRVSIRIRAQGDHKRDAEVTVTAEAHVAPFVEVGATLSSVAGVELTVTNRGNDVVHAVVNGSDTSGRPLGAQPATLVLEPGATSMVAIDVPRRGHPFSVTVEPSGAPAITVEGSLPKAAPPRKRIGIAIAVFLAIAVLAAVLRGTVFSSSTSGAKVVSAVTSCAAGGHLAHDANGQIRHNVVEPDNFSFLFLQPGGCQPVRWNPCQPIHYVINQTSATPAQVADTRQAAADVAQATGMTFTYDGTTTESSNDFQPFAPALFGPRWAPILVDWAHIGGSDNLTEVAGGGVPVQIQGVDVSGSVFLNVDAHLANNVAIPDGFGAGVTWGRILLHEFGHVVGLGHVSGFDQIMHEPVTEQTSPTSAYGIGDLAGLRLLGRGAGCLSTPPVPATGP